MEGLTIIIMEGEIDMNKKKIIIYAGVLLVTMIFVGVGIVSSNPSQSIGIDIGCNRIYDVNRDKVINFQDAGLCWIYATSPELHDFHGDLLYDVNMDGRVNFQDAGLIWVNRD